ncbi:MAG: phenylalanine 4-monooxygenase [Acidobacteria bacterium]|nr:MAG: phenylalanine 4-monooxygenase [Acidobacteriota bacterium]REK00289.1 MAG: phenylalanine 4-monooxygenase [Acidobacteriota bacterium]
MTITETAPASNDLTTTRAPFIEEAKGRGDLFIHQPYELYSEENHETWRRLYAALVPQWQRFAHPRFIEGLNNLALTSERVPRLEEINEFLEPLSAFESKAVSGYVPAYLFFDCLRQREFPTTITIRDARSLDYLPEPDIFHDLAGHVPMHTDRTFSDILVRFGEVAATAAKMSRDLDSSRRTKVTSSVIKAMARFFWFTVEFGLMKRPKGGAARLETVDEPVAPADTELCVYGSGLLSSREEIEYSIVSDEVQRYPFRLEWVANQYFEIDHVQPLLFYVDDFDHLFAEVERLEEWVLSGRLDNVAPGEPLVNEQDLQSFLDAG